MNSRLMELLQIFSSIHDLHDQEEIQHIVMKAFSKISQEMRCLIMELDTNKDELVHIASMNLPDSFVEAMQRIPNGTGACGYACKHNQLRIIADLQHDTSWEPYRIHSDQANLRSVWAVPITYQNKTYGGIAFYNEAIHYPSEDDVLIASWIAKQFAIAIHNNRMLVEQKQLQMDIISSFVHSVETRDFYTFGHSQHVAEYANILGEAIGLSAEELDKLYNGGLLHDIGKILTPDRVLLNPGKLTNEEYEIIKAHPVQGVNMIKNIPSLQEYIPIVRHHHERLDGRGYPDGLSGDEIPLLARIVCIADSFDAMTSKRVYRTNMPFQQALNELIRCSGTQFDPDLVSVFIKIIPEKYPDFFRNSQLRQVKN